MISKLFVSIAAFSCLAASASTAQPFEFKARVGFAEDQDRIVEHVLTDDGRRLVLFGEKFIQVWDVETAKLVTSTPHDIPRLTSTDGFVSKYLLLGLPQILNWKPYLVDPNGKWLATIEKQAPDQTFKSAVIRDIATAKQIAVFKLPNVSVDFIAYDKSNDTIMTRGRSDDVATFVNFDGKTFQERLSLSFTDYEWHQTIRNDAKVIVGSGDTKGVGYLWIGAKQGDRLTLRDVKSGAIEKEFTAENLLARTPFRDTTITPDEKYMFARRDDRLFVWEIEGQGKPKFEIVSSDAKVKPLISALVGTTHLVVSFDKKIAIYDLAGDGRSAFELVPRLPNGWFDFRGVTGDGKYLAVEDASGVRVVATSGKGNPVFTVTTASATERLHYVGFIDGGKYLTVTRSNRSAKKPDRAELYDPATGRLVHEIASGVSTESRFTTDKKHLYFTGVGFASFWNFADKRALHIDLKTYTPPRLQSPDDKYGVVDSSEPYNVEKIAISPDNRYMMRYGGDTVTVFDLATGKEIQSIFDAAKVKHDKKNKVKKSGLAEAGWAADGKVVYGFETGNLFGKRRSVNFFSRNN